MRFRCEFGSGATGDREGRREADVDPDRDFFGTQLVSAIIGSFDDGGESAGDDCLFATAGRGPDRMEFFGTVVVPKSPAEAALLYASKPVFASAHVGIVRIVGLELDLVGAVTLTHGQLRSLARIMLADRELHPTPSQPNP